MVAVINIVCPQELISCMLRIRRTYDGFIKLSTFTITCFNLSTTN